MKKKEQKLYFFNMIFDFVLLNLSYIIVLILKNRLLLNDNTKILFFIFNLAWLIVIFIFPYRIRFDYKQHIKIELLRALLLISLTSFVLFIIKFPSYSRFIILGTIILFLFINFISDFIIRRFVYKKLRKSKNRKELLIIGAGVKGYQFYEFIQNNKEMGYSVIGFLDDNKKNLKKYSILGKIDSLEDIIIKNNIDEIVIALPFMTDMAKQKKIVEVCNFWGIRLRILPDYYRLLGEDYEISKFGDIPIINYEEFPLDNFVNYSIKRIFDIVFSFIFLVLISPLLLFISIIIKLESSGPILYKPVRVGEMGIKFTLLKFRTMHHNDDEENGSRSTVEDDERITRFGQILRKSNLDELPQFLNILKGDMAVVGPRPHRVWLDNEFRESVKEYMKRHYIKPGLTGWAQVNGWRGPTDTIEKKEQRVKHDLYYIKNWSFWFDLQIIWLTVFGKETSRNAF